MSCTARFLVLHYSELNSLRRLCRARLLHMFLKRFWFLSSAGNKLYQGHSLSLLQQLLSVLNTRRCLKDYSFSGLFPWWVEVSFPFHLYLKQREIFYYSDQTVNDTIARFYSLHASSRTPPPTPRYESPSIFHFQHNELDFAGRTIKYTSIPREKIPLHVKFSPFWRSAETLLVTWSVIYVANPFQHGVTYTAVSSL